MRGNNLIVPPLLDGAKVLIYTANEHCNNYGYVLFEDENKKVGITAFAVAKYDGGRGYYLFSCDWSATIKMQSKNTLV